MARPMSRPEDRRIHVLLVEDSLADALLMRGLLEQDPSVRVTLAQDGLRGSQLVEHQKWDLVITDINLPGRDGIDVIQICREHQADTPIVATSAYASSAYQEAAFRAGASEFLAKPIEAKEFLATIQGLVASRVKGKAAHQARVILAVSTFPGDVEAGCAGILLKHVAGGDEVHHLVLTLGATGKEGEDRLAAAQKAGEVLGFRLLGPGSGAPALPDLHYSTARIQEALDLVSPAMVFSPSGHDLRESRQAAFQAAVLAAAEVPGHYCYQAATTTLEFRPTRFEDISEFLDRKMEALAHYQALVRGRPHLDPELARASALYWGRFLGYREAEPLEVVRHSL